MSVTLRKFKMELAKVLKLLSWLPSSLQMIMVAIKKATRIASDLVGAALRNASCGGNGGGNGGGVGGGDGG